MIEIENVTKRFGSKTAVNRLSLTVASGEFFGFVGPNGAGKTTTIKVIVGLLRADEGTARICGHDIQKDAVAAKALISHIPDQPYLYGKLTGREFLEFVARMYRLESEKARRRIEELSDVLVLHDYLDDLAEGYSHGMKQRVVIASALLHDPKVVVVDEPMVGLDPRSVRVVKDLLRNLSQSGATVFMSTHTLAVAEELAARIGVIDHGRMVAVGTLDELRKASGGAEGLEESFLRLTAEEGMSVAARLMTLAWVRAKTVRNSVRVLRQHSSLKVFVITLFAIGLWTGLFLLFDYGFRFLETGPISEFRHLVAEVLFAIFFLSLLMLLTFSNAIIAYGSLFRSEETAFLFAGPFLPWQIIFACKLSETLLFSSWAFLFLGLPLIVAYGVSNHSLVEKVVERAPWYYYPGAAAFFGVFAIIPAAVGGSLTLLITRFVPRSPRKMLILLAVIVILPLMVWAAGFLRLHNAGGAYSGDVWIRNALGRLNLSESPLLPSFWAGDGIVLLGKGELREALYRFLLLLSTALFAAMVSMYLAWWFYTTAYYRAQSQSRKRKGALSGGFYRVLEWSLPGMNPELRALIVKDVKTFARDPVQWSQVLIFFGLLGIYFANMRQLQYDAKSPLWQNFISILNLVATCLTLSTFTSRFIFPLLSLEGRNFWILGLLPIERRNLLYSKFWFAFIGSFAISEGLMGLSDLILREPAPVAALHAMAVLIISSGLSALAVGVGALYPNLHEDNPSKIVSGFGGTLNLVLSVAFVALIVVLMVVPYHLVQMGTVQTAFLQRLMLPGMALAGVVGAVAVIVPLWLGVRAFERFEA